MINDFINLFNKFCFECMGLKKVDLTGFEPVAS